MSPFETMMRRIEAGAYTSVSTSKDSCSHALLEREFKNEVLTLYRVENHPKASRCFDIAWDHARFRGLGEVLGLFDDLLDLIKS